MLLLATVLLPFDHMEYRVLVPVATASLIPVDTTNTGRHVSAISM